VTDGAFELCVRPQWKPHFGYFAGANNSAGASVTHFTYDTKGELLTITDPLGHVTTMTYTTAGLIATIKDAQNNITTYG